MGEVPTYGIATGNRFIMADIDDDIEDPAQFYDIIEQSLEAKKAEQKKKKEKKPEKKKEEEKKPEKKEEDQTSEQPFRGRGGRGGRGRGARGGRGGRGGNREDGDNRFNRDESRGGGRGGRYNRDEDSRPPRMQDDGGDSKFDDGEERRGRGGYRGRGNNRGRGRGGYRGGNRQFDRHSGDGRTRPGEPDKREGLGSHNWGNPTEEETAPTAPDWGTTENTGGDGWAAASEPASDSGGWGAIETPATSEPSGFNNVEPSGFDNVQPSGFDDVQPSGFDNVSAFDNVAGTGENNESGPSKEDEEEANQMTLDEYMAKMSTEQKEASFNIRRPGENEDDSQWKNFAPLKKDSADAAYMGGMDKYEKVIVPGGRKKNFVSLDVKFTNPTRRGGRGRDDRGGRGRGRGDRREGGDGGERRGRDDGERREPREQRPPAGSPKSQKPPNLENFSDAEFPSLS